MEQGDKDRIGRNLRIYITQSEFTQKKLAREVRCGQSTISDIIKGKSDPAFSLMKRIVDTLGITCEDILKDPKRKI